MPGHVVGGAYEVGDQIGEGGMAVVYKARQKSLNRWVAIKAMHSRLAADPEFVARFEGESGALASLSHPNIVSIIDRGVENKVYYFVMEYIDGGNLDLKIIDNKLTPNDWRQVITSSASALEYVHRHGIVHRDIKPSNILIDLEGRVKLGDFGIAHIISGDKGENAVIPGANRAVGTAHYMAPEQISDPASVDHRVDVYALAVTFYKMMTRHLPVGEYKAPSELNPEIPVAVDAVIFQAMAPNRDDRYQTVKDFCDDLLKALKEQSVSIASILNYRTPTSGSSLYTGADFRTPVPSSGDNKKPTTASLDRKSGTGTGTGTGTGGTGTGTSSGRQAPPPTSGSGVFRPPVFKTPLPMEGGKVYASKDLTPLPVAPDSTSASKRPAAESPAPTSSRTMLLLVAAVLLIGAVVVVAMMMSGGSDSSSTASRPPVVAPTTPPNPEDAESPAQQRERRKRELEEQRKAEIMKNTGSTAPAP